MAPTQELLELARLVRSQRQAALATLDAENLPLASTVAYVPELDFSGFLLHLSRLAHHTRNLLHNPAASLVISEPDSGEGAVQMLARLSLRGDVHEIVRGSDDYRQARELYLARLPDAAATFDFADFILFRLIPRSARYVGGFAGARNFTPRDLVEAAHLGRAGT